MTLSTLLSTLLVPLTSLVQSPFQQPSSRSMTDQVDLLILGAGWTASFLVPHLRAHHPNLSFAATTRDGRDDTLKWSFDPDREGKDQFEGLPKARAVLVTFPIRGEGGSRRLVQGYEEHAGSRARWIQLGSSGIWDGGPTLASLRASSPSSTAKPPPFQWTTRHSPYDRTNPRAIAEDELLSQHADTIVLNLVGLWGGTRNPLNWFARIAPTKSALEQKGSLHLIHGLDVARAIVAVVLAPTLPRSAESVREGRGERWVVSDLRVLDWWDLVSSHPSPPPSSASHDGESSPDRTKWVLDLMHTHNIRGLPRSPEELGRAIDSSEFWRAFGVGPVKGRWEEGKL
ncbi:hypothetical protein NBRC10512_006376 [Rhodotorula toruloides]|uniref:RHTO0S01e02256g1_1 n=2 Tax=Rhodotorula toruloides TaxID=5286 RepID=A0A061AEK0_RHOTO|nr:uncharacterized protein RHTO_04061 [Rhodotorula toruloides NP11]EMS19769.1 hypothetical protein RHTO_04061 [Rhodotorula toruloides NP11]CDR35570.1 RHTO0S01e02256g1_1 [Rhodotorula toruloides]